MSALHVKHHASKPAVYLTIARTAGIVPRTCTMCGARPSRPGQRNCLECHAEAQRKYRERRREEINELRRIARRVEKRRRA